MLAHLDDFADDGVGVAAWGQCLAELKPPHRAGAGSADIQGGHRAARGVSQRNSDLGALARNTGTAHRHEDAQWSCRRCALLTAGDRDGEGSGKPPGGLRDQRSEASGDCRRLTADQQQPVTLMSLGGNRALRGRERTGARRDVDWIRGDGGRRYSAGCARRGTRRSSRFHECA